MESKWCTNLYELGLLNWFFTRAARLLDVPGPTTYYLVNAPRETNPLPVFVAVSADRWGSGVWNAHPTVGPFPYGYNVEAP